MRHNGGTVWFDELGAPWQKHRCGGDGSEAAAAVQAAQERLQTAVIDLGDHGTNDATWIGLGIVLESPGREDDSSGARLLPVFAGSAVVLTTTGQTLFVDVSPERVLEVGQLVMIRCTPTAAAIEPFELG